LSANSSRKACHPVGAAVMQQAAAWREPSQAGEAQGQHQPQVDTPKQLYGSLDGFMAHLEGGWPAMKVGAWWTTSRRPDGSLSADTFGYYSDWLPAAEFSDLSWASGWQRLADQADAVILGADGADWMWPIVQQPCPQAVQIVDWYQALGYGRAVAPAAFPAETARATWFEQPRHDLWLGRLAAVFRACRACGTRVPEPVKKAVTYFANNRPRMRYHRFRAAGYQIGSGTRERGCKQLGTGGLKSAGAQWRATGARLIAKARAA
jgi:hypothetical protein